MLDIRMAFNCVLGSHTLTMCHMSHVGIVDNNVRKGGKA